MIIITWHVLYVVQYYRKWICLSPMYIFLKGNIKLIKHEALLILRNGILSFELFCPQLTCAKITHFSIQTEVEIISDLFLDLTVFMEKMKHELLPFVWMRLRDIPRRSDFDKKRVSWCVWILCVYMYGICECVPVMSLALCSILPSLHVLSSSQVEHYFTCLTKT